MFVVLSPFTQWWPVVAIVYLTALMTDFVDGRLARAKQVASRIGGAMDVFGDRYLAAVSLLYAAVRGVHLVIVAIIILRDLYALSMRLLLVDGRRVMFSSSKVGGLVLVIISAGTLNLLCHPTAAATLDYQAPFALVALFYLFYFPWTLKVSWHRICRAINSDLEEPRSSDSPD
jgi:CDP-diacylglycerol--glycerol-3-phosphate 3-phosphatidyltransferase